VPKLSRRFVSTSTTDLSNSLLLMNRKSLMEIGNFTPLIAQVTSINSMIGIDGVKAREIEYKISKLKEESKTPKYEKSANPTDITPSPARSSRSGATPYIPPASDRV
jgi:hypothetical protein